MGRGRRGAGFTLRGGGDPYEAPGAVHEVHQGVVGEGREREVQLQGGGLKGALALGGGPVRPVQLLVAEAHLGAVLLGRLLAGHVGEEPADAQGHGLLAERGAEPDRAAAPAVTGGGLVAARADPQLVGGGRRALGEHVLQGVLQLLSALGEQFADRAAEQHLAGRAQHAGGLRVGLGGPQVGVDHHHTPGGVGEQRLAQRDGPLQVDLCVHLGEGAVDARGPVVGARHGRALGADQHTAAVLGHQGEFVHLAAVRVHCREE